jgi:hydroxylysine kinase
VPNSSRVVDAPHPIDGLHAAPTVAESFAEALAAEHYGLSATAHRLGSERDQNFRLRTRGGRDYVLKIANPAEDRGVTNLQTEALRHLATVDSSLPVPRVFPALNGDVELDVRFDDGSTRLVRLLSFLEGTPLHAAEGSAALRRDLGRCAARLAHALRDFRHAARHKLLWDLQHAAELRPLVDAVTANQHRLVGRVLDNFDAHALPALRDLGKQHVHNDLNPHNVVVDPANHERIAGIIDFGDLTFTARVNDLAIAAAYQVADSDDPLAPVCDVVAAYHAVTPLDLRECEVLFDLIATRIAMTVVISNWRAIRYPDNREYILRNSKAASARLGRIARLSRRQAEQQIRRACDLE